MLPQFASTVKGCFFREKTCGFRVLWTCRSVQTTELDGAPYLSRRFPFPLLLLSLFVLCVADTRPSSCKLPILPSLTTTAACCLPQKVEQRNQADQQSIREVRPRSVKPTSVGEPSRLLSKLAAKRLMLYGMYLLTWEGRVTFQKQPIRYTTTNPNSDAGFRPRKKTKLVESEATRGQRGHRRP